MAALLNHLWFVVIPFGLINVGFVYWRALPHLNQNLPLKRRAQIAAATVAVALTVTASLIGLVQILGGFNNPFYIYSADIENPYVLAGKILILVFWIKVIAWSWFTDGLISYAKLFFNPMSELQKKVARGGATVVALFGITFLSLYHGSAVPVIVNNYNGDTIEWISVQYVGGETRLEKIDTKTRAVMSIKPNRVSHLSVSFKLAGEKSASRADLPFMLSDVAMGYLNLFVTRDGQLGVGAHLMFN